MKKGRKVIDLKFISGSDVLLPHNIDNEWNKEMYITKLNEGLFESLNPSALFGIGNHSGVGYYKRIERSINTKLYKHLL
jgi:hypothetical protein